MSLQPEERGPLTLTGGLLGSETGPRGLSAVPVSSSMGLPLRWIFFAFRVYRQSFTELGSGYAWPLPRGGCFSQVISSHGTIDVTRVSVPQFLVLSQQRFGMTDIKAPRHVTALRSWTDRVIVLRSQMDHVIALRQISVTAQCYSSILFRRLQGDPSLKKRREWRSPPVHVHTWERESDREFLAPSFICFLPPGPALCKLGSASSAVLPEVLRTLL